MMNDIEKIRQRINDFAPYQRVVDVVLIVSLLMVMIGFASLHFPSLDGWWVGAGIIGVLFSVKFNFWQMYWKVGRSKVFYGLLAMTDSPATKKSVEKASDEYRHIVRKNGAWSFKLLCASLLFGASISYYNNIVIAAGVSFVYILTLAGLYFKLMSMVDEYEEFCGDMLDGDE